MKILSKTNKSVLVESPLFICNDGSHAKDLCRVNLEWLASSGITLEQAVTSGTEKTRLDFKEWVLK